MTQRKLIVCPGPTPELWMVYAGETRIGSVHLDRERGGWTPLGAFAFDRAGHPQVYGSREAAVDVLERVYSARLTEAFAARVARMNVQLAKMQRAEA